MFRFSKRSPTLILLIKNFLQRKAFAKGWYLKNVRLAIPLNNKRNDKINEMILNKRGQFIAEAKL